MTNYEKVDVGLWKDLPRQVFERPPLRKEGKRFIGEEAKTSGCEISINHLKAGDGYPFLHRHNENEEVYVVIHGEGQMLMDGTVIQISEGSVVKVRPEGVRSIRASDASSLDYICVQAKAGSLGAYDVSDGTLVPGDVVWS